MCDVSKLKSDFSTTQWNKRLKYDTNDNMTCKICLEYEQLQKQVAVLQDQVGFLMKSHNMESIFALRALITEAKRKGLEHFSDDVARLTKKLKNYDENIAAHVATPHRILEAIREQSVERTRRTLMEMFEGVYGNYENDLDDEFSIFDDF